jgi:hypothetical protein
MGIKKSDGCEAVFLCDHPAINRKYPAVKYGDCGVVVPAHKFDIETDPDHPLRFYPSAWGYIYCFPVSEREIRLTSGLQPTPTTRLGGE